MAKVMLVEDDNNLREIYEARLQAEGYTIVSAKDGEEALVVAKAEKPDLIISDVMMPKISGFEMLDILRNTDGLKDVKVIMLTALGQSDDQQRADKLGADRYLVKSQVTLEDIVDVTRKLLAADGVAAEPAAAPAVAAEPAPTPAEPIATPTVSTPIAVSQAPADDAAAVTTPVSEPVATDPAPDNSAQSSQEEQAGVEAQIEDFVAGATSEADAPSVTAAAPPAEEAPAAEPPTVTSAPTVTTDVAAATDDKLMADAVNTLVTDTQPPVAAVTAPAPDPAASTAAETPAQPANTDESSGSTGGTRIITPLDASPKPDINALLAAEEAKEGSPTPPPNTSVQPDKPVDPNSIAL